MVETADGGYEWKDSDDEREDKKLFLDEFKYVISNVFRESDMAFVYVDRTNNLTIIHRDLYGKRSLMI